MKYDAADFTETDPAPEVPPGMEEIQTWDEPAESTGTRIRPIPPADEADVAPLVEEGIEEADRELRLEDEAESEDEEIDSDENLPPTSGILS